MLDDKVKVLKLQLRWAAPALLVLSACAAPSDSSVPPGTAPGDTEPAAAGTQDVSAGNTRDDSLMRLATEAKPPAVASANGELEPDPSFSGCLTVLSGEPGPHQVVEYSVWSEDAAQRVLVQLPSDAQGTPLDNTDPRIGRVARYWKRDAQGRVVLRAVDGLRYDVQLDEHGNIASARVSSLDVVDLAVDDSGQLHSSIEYSNEYDEHGLLQRSSTVPSGEVTLTTTSYTHDAQGRCETVTSERGDVQRRDYDSAGRLWHRILESSESSGYRDGNSTATYEYNDRGRLLSAKVEIPTWQVPQSLLQLTYREDGAVVENVTSRSDDTPATSYRRVWSPGCSELLPRLLEVPAQACETRLGFAGELFIPGRLP